MNNCDILEYDIFFTKKKIIIKYDDAFKKWKHKCLTDKKYLKKLLGNDYKKKFK